MPTIADGFGAGFEFPSEEAHVVRRSIEAIVATVNIADRRGCEFFGINVVEQRNLDGVKRAAHCFELTPTRRSDSACLAKVKLDGRLWASWRRPLIFRLTVLALGEAKASGRRWNEPGARFRAARAVALERSLSEIEFRLKANGAAMAASGVSLHRHGMSPQSG
jgi:hypothetical protein